MSFHILFIALAAIFQVFAAIFAVRLIRITGIRTPWVVMMCAILVEFLRRIFSLYNHLLAPYHVPHPLHDDVFAMAISLLMCIGVAKIKPVFCSIRDSEEKMREAMLGAEQERARSESILAGIGDGLSIQDRDLRIIYQNRAHIAYFGDQKGKFCYNAYRGLEDVCNPCPILVAMEDGKIHTREMRKKCNHGTSSFEVTASPLRDAAGSIVAGIEVVHNIDRRKMVERERENLIGKLQEALANIKTLRGLLPMCAGCKKIRDDKGYWNQIEAYVKEHSEAEFSHSLCPDCARKLYPEYYES